MCCESFSKFISHLHDSKYGDLVFGRIGRSTHWGQGLEMGNSMYEGDHKQQLKRNSVVEERCHFEKSENSPPRGDAMGIHRFENGATTPSALYQKYNSDEVVLVGIRSSGSS